MIKVTEACVIAGKAGSCEQCPVALAMLIAGYRGVTIGEYAITHLSDDQRSLLVYDTPAVVRVWIKKFDETLYNDPFEFALGDVKEIYTLDEMQK